MVIEGEKFLLGCIRERNLSNNCFDIIDLKRGRAAWRWLAMNIEESYIVGLIDGEGTINIINYPDGRVRPQVLVFNTNKDVLKIIKEKLQLKAPILTVSRTNDGIKRTKKMYRLQIRAKTDVQKIFEILEKHPPIIKNKEFKTVKELTKSWLTT